MSGVSAPPDPARFAYRKDLADTALAGRVIASHYAEPLPRRIVSDSIARLEPSADSAEVARVTAGQSFRMLDCSLGWAWGYLEDGRVAYLAEATIAP